MGISLVDGGDDGKRAGKIGGGAACSALALGMNPRESAAVGVLMNTRGLVELIILNIGLDAHVLTEVTRSLPPPYKFCREGTAGPSAPGRASA